MILSTIDGRKQLFLICLEILKYCKTQITHYIRDASMWLALFTHEIPQLLHQSKTEAEKKKERKGQLKCPTRIIHCFQFASWIVRYLACCKNFVFLFTNALSFNQSTGISRRNIKKKKNKNQQTSNIFFS